MKPQVKAVVFRTVLLVVVLCALAAWGRLFDNEPPSLSTDSPVSCLQSARIPDALDEVMVEYTGFRVSFNPEYHIPNYVAWELTAVEAEGNLPRRSKFFADETVRGCPSLEDYRNSGFDRGHMAPAADMKWSEAAMDDSHSLVNMCPQDHGVNSGIWSTIEQKTRNWAKRDSSLIVICGPVLSDVMPQEIGTTGVKVPRRFFKILLAPFANPPRAIGFIVPNYYNSFTIDQLVCTVDEVEAITGYDFFECLPDSIENIIESKANLNIWNKTKH